MSEDTSFLEDVYYETDWLEGNTSVYHLDMTTPAYIYHESWITAFSYNKTLTGIPDGNHSITVIAVADGSYVRGCTYYHFEIGGYSSVNFVIDTTSPKISVQSLENKTFETSDVPLNFAVNEPASQIKYSLDGQENVTITGNTTLTGLSSGEHNVTVYATDEAGNTGASEPLFFNVNVSDPFPVVPVAAASASVAIVLVGASLLVYFKKRKH
jgi:hypothetical protein